MHSARNASKKNGGEVIRANRLRQQSPKRVGGERNDFCETLFTALGFLKRRGSPHPPFVDRWRQRGRAASIYLVPLGRGSGHCCAVTFEKSCSLPVKRSTGPPGSCIMKIDILLSFYVKTKTSKYRSKGRKTVATSPRSEQPGTYFVQDRASLEEMNRLHIQDQFLTQQMGGVLPEQSEPTRFQRILDVG